MTGYNLNDILTDQKVIFLQKAGLIARDIPLESFLKTRQTVVITGVRRSGKSSLLFLIKEALGLTESEFCYCNFDDERITSDTKTLNEVYEIHVKTYRAEPVFFFDEIQSVKGWEKFVNRMYEQGRKIFVTGSNATLLSSEIATSLTGRNKVLELFPFSFAEYLRFKERNYNTNRLSVKARALLLNDLNTFLENGGFPLVVKEDDAELVQPLFQDILYRDIVARYSLTNVDEIRQIALFLASNVGKLFSYATLREISGVKSLSSVKVYLHYYEASFLFFYLKKFSFSVKKQIMNSRKVYAVDNAIATRLGFGFSKNAGRLLENCVFVELRRRGFDIYYFSEKHECDFLIRKNLKVIEAIQVVYELNSSNVAREINGLLEAVKKFDIPKATLIAYDYGKLSEPLPAGINVVPAYQWLLSEE